MLNIGSDKNNRSAASPMKYDWLPAGGVFMWNNYKTRDKVEQKTASQSFVLIIHIKFKVPVQQ